jgi:hypothetical protein
MTQEIDTTMKAMKEQLTKLTESFKIPGVDIDALMELQRKNIEARCPRLRS